MVKRVVAHARCVAEYHFRHSKSFEIHFWNEADALQTRVLFYAFNAPRTLTSRFPWLEAREMLKDGMFACLIMHFITSEQHTNRVTCTCIQWFKGAKIVL